MGTLESPWCGGSNEYPKSTFLSRNKNNIVQPCEPQFYYIKVGFKGVKIIYACFREVTLENQKKKKKKKWFVCPFYCFTKKGDSPLYTFFKLPILSKHSDDFNLLRMAIRNNVLSLHYNVKFIYFWYWKELLHLNVAVVMGTHNSCFGTEKKMRK